MPEDSQVVERAWDAFITFPLQTKLPNQTLPIWVVQIGASPPTPRAFGMNWSLPPGDKGNHFFVIVKGEVTAPRQASGRTAG